MNTQKGFVWPIVIIVIIIVVLGTTGYFVCRHYTAPAEIVAPVEYDQNTNTEIEIDQTEDWQTYTNTEYGFEFEYPLYSEIEISDQNRGFISEPSALLRIAFYNYYEEEPFQKKPFDFNLNSKEHPVCTGSLGFTINDEFVIDPMEGVSTKTTNESFLKELNQMYDTSEYIIIDDIEGIRRNKFIGLPPGGGGNEDRIWLPIDSKLYIFSYTIDREVLGLEENYIKCRDEQKKIFEQMLSTFKFTN